MSFNSGSISIVGGSVATGAADVGSKVLGASVVGAKVDGASVGGLLVVVFVDGDNDGAVVGFSTGDDVVGVCDGTGEAVDTVIGGAVDWTMLGSSSSFLPTEYPIPTPRPIAISRQRRQRHRRQRQRGHR